MRKLKRPGMLAFVAVMFLCFGSGSHAALSAYLTLEGPNGPIEGDVQTAGREGTIEAFEAHHLISVPVDPRTGQVTGSPAHEPFIFTKRIDKSSPLLLKALALNETLPTAMFKYFRIGTEGSEEHYYTVILSNVKVVAFEPLSPNNRDATNSAFPNMERIRLGYGQIFHRWEPDGIEFETTVNVPN